MRAERTAPRSTVPPVWATTRAQRTYSGSRRGASRRSCGRKGYRRCGSTTAATRRPTCCWLGAYHPRVAATKMEAALGWAVAVNRGVKRTPVRLGSGQDARFVLNLAEGVGFEPTVGLHPRRFSRPMHSSALPPLRAGAIVSRHRSHAAWPCGVQGWIPAAVGRGVGHCLGGTVIIGLATGAWGSAVHRRRDRRAKSRSGTDALQPAEIGAQYLRDQHAAIGLLVRL